MVKSLKSIFMLGFYAVGLIAVVGIWDYTRQAKDAGYAYSFDDYRLSVAERYGAEAEIAFTVLDLAKATSIRGFDMVDQTGVLANAEVTLDVTGSVTSGDSTVAPGTGSEVIVLASAASVLAPESSLYPQARGQR